MTAIFQFSCFLLNNAFVNVVSWFTASSLALSSEHLQQLANKNLL